MLFTVQLTSTDMHFCVVAGYSNDSVSHPNLSFHRLPLEKKSLLKMWMHKIGRKNLPLNSNSRVCSNHFINSTGCNRLRHDEFPTENLPSLPTQVTSKPRKQPKERFSTSNCDPFGDSDGSVVTNDPGCSSLDTSVNTDITGSDKQLKDEIVKLNNEMKFLKLKVASLKLCLHNKAVCNNVSYYTGFTSVETLNACCEYLGPAVRNVSYWNGGKSKGKDECKGRGRHRALPPLEEFFLVLVRL